MQENKVKLDHTVKAESYQRTAPALLAYLLRQVASREDAEDLLLEVFLAALSNEHFMALPEGKQMAWLRTVARNKVADHYRRTSRQIHVPIMQVADVIYAREDLEPERVALRGEEYTQLHRSLRGLPAFQQDVLTLRFGYGLSCIQIAAITEKSEGAIRMLLSRTLKALRKLYTQD